MKMLSKIWTKIQNQPLDIWLFYGFLLTFVLSVRKVLFYFSVEGTFNEYAGIYVYISDIFLLLAIIFWIATILSNNLNDLSTKKVWITKSVHSLSQMFHVKQNLFSWVCILPLVLVLWSFSSILWSENQAVALFRSMKLLELYFLFLYIKFRIKPLLLDNKLALRKCFFNIFIFIALFQSFLAIGQFILQHSVGLFWLKESLISPNIPGVAKIIVGGHKIIRAYGLFPHSNILGAFLLFSLILTLIYLRLFHVEQKTKKEFILKGSILIQFVALCLTFSKSAIIGLILSLIYLNVSRGTSMKVDFSKKMFNLCKSQVKKIILLVIILILAVVVIKPDLKSFFLKSLEERQFYLDVSRGTILNNPALGVGSGQFVLNMPKYSRETIQNWQFQPVHNVFLLIWSELGLVGLVLFGLFLWQMFRSPQDNSLFKPYFKAILVGFIFIMLFDHYLWDIQQGELMFWIVLGFI